MPDKRIFVAIHYTPTNDFLSWYQELKRQAFEENVKWTDVSNFHITLKFIGDTSDRLIGGLASSLREVALKFAPFELTPAGFGYFGPAHAPRVFWTAIDDPSQTLASLANAVDEVCHDVLQTENEPQPFKAHLTLGRPKKISAPGRVKEWVEKYRNNVFRPFKVNEFLLVWSTLTLAGPVYKTLFSFPLGRV